MSHKYRCRWRPRLSAARRWLAANGRNAAKAYRSALWLPHGHPGTDDAMAYIYWHMAGNGALPQYQPVPGERYDIATAADTHLVTQSPFAQEEPHET